MLYDNRLTPWAKAGVNVSAIDELDEVLTASGLDFFVKKAPVLFDPYYDDKNKAGKQITEMNGDFVTYRTDTNAPFGVVGSKYEVVQNYEAFKFVEELYKDGSIKYETAGIFDGGARMFLSVQLPGSINLDNKDTINKFIVFTTTHDGSGSIMIIITGVRVVCKNTLQLAIRNASNKFIIKHTKRAEDRIESARKIIMAQENYFKELGDMMLKLKSVQITDKGITQTLAYMFLANDEYNHFINQKFDLYRNDILSTRKINQITDVRRSLTTAPGQEWHSGTGLWLYNGLTSYFHNVKEYKSDDAKITSVIEDKEGIKLSRVVDTLLQTV